MLRDPALEDSYPAAWDEWQASGDAAAWEAVSADGLADAARRAPLDEALRLHLRL